MKAKQILVRVLRCIVYPVYFTLFIVTFFPGLLIAYIIAGNSEDWWKWIDAIGKKICF